MADNDKTVNIAIKTTADTAGVKQAQTAVENLTPPVQHLNEKTVTSGQSMGKFGMLANQASYQITDFTNQVSMGTSAITAFSQQAPQLIGAFQMAGVVSGPLTLVMAGLAVAIPIVAIGVKALAGAFGDAGKAAVGMGEKLDTLAKKSGDLDFQAITDANDDAKRAIEATDLLAEKFNAAAKADSAASVAALSNAEKNQKAQALVAEALGLQVDKYEQIVQLAQIQAELDAAKAEAAKQAEAFTMQQAVREANKEIEKIQQQEAYKRHLEEQLLVHQQILERIEATNRAAEAANVKRGLETPLMDAAKDLHYGPLASPFILRDLNRRGEISQENAQYDKSKDWNEALETQARTTVDKLIEALKNVTDQTENDQAKLDNLNAKLNDQDAAKNAKIAEIDQTLQADRTLADLTTLEAKQKASADTIKDVLSRTEAHGAAQEAARERLTQIVADGIVTANEMNEVNRNLTILMGGLQSGMETTNGNVQEVIRIVSNLQQRQADLTAQIANLKAAR